MVFQLDDDEMALVIKPLYEANGEWEGDVATGVAMNETINLDLNIQRGMVNIITLMTSFLSYSDDKEELVDEVLKWRDKLFEDLDESPLAEYETDKDSNIITLTKFTKTKGSA